jgi:beta-ureidopropionase / N-carbamoyl-L-amino-acid hydrolase
VNLTQLDGIYEHSPWVAQRALLNQSESTVKSLPQLKQLFIQAVTQASREEQLQLIRAHPELAGRAMVAGTLTNESTGEQSAAGLTHCTPEQFARLQQLNADYNNKFGWPFILAVRGPRGLGFTRDQIIDIFTRRLTHHPDFELHECLRQIHRIAEIRLNDRFNIQPVLGNQLWDWQEALANHSDAGFKEKKQLTVTYQTAAHQACARDIAQHMTQAGFDTVDIDVLGNVVGRYQPLSAANQSMTKPQWLMTGSHYDTVRNGGKYDGRLGIFIPIQVVAQLALAKKRLAYGIEVVAFAEEEGQRYKATFLSASALTGTFNPDWLIQTDTAGIPMATALGLTPEQAMEKINLLKREPQDYLGFVEVHIEQGPVLNEMNLPLAAVTSINGSVRYLASIKGVASHAGTTPMNRRKDAVIACSELALFMEQRAGADANCVATMGQLNVPGGSINVVPGQCDFSLDMRAPNNEQRDLLANDVLEKLQSICAQRGLQYRVEQTLCADAAPSDPQLQKHWENAIAALGLSVVCLPSGAGHDAMKLHDIMPQAMLFVRGENAGISHNPLESTTNDDMQLALDAFTHLTNQLHDQYRPG